MNIPFDLSHLVARTTFSDGLRTRLNIHVAFYCLRTETRLILRFSLYFTEVLKELSADYCYLLFTKYASPMSTAEQKSHYAHCLVSLFILSLGAKFCFNSLKTNNVG
jgi:hypothetical protein